MFLIVGPDAYSAPPVDTWMIPSLPASENPARTALRVCELVMLMAGKAYEFALAASSIAAYTSGVAMGMSAPVFVGPGQSVTTDPAAGRRGVESGQLPSFDVSIHWLPRE